MDARLRIFHLILETHSQIVYAYQLTYGFTITLVKACILMFYHRTFVSHGFRRTVWGMAAFILLYFVPFTTAAIFQCRPLRLAWNKTLDGVCIDYVAYFKAASIVNLVTDVLLLVMPLPVVWRLNITPRQKIAVTGIFTLGGLSVSLLYPHYGSSPGSS